jgi:Zn-dependent protease with chaperone function
MSFFDRQERARRSTLAFLLLFGLAVCLIVAAVSSLCWGFVVFVSGMGILKIPELNQDPTPLFWPVIQYSAAATTLFVGSVTLFWVWKLSAGGRAVAEMAGARLVSIPKNSKEKMLSNVVEEMALASGLPVPLTYVLDGETSINAFAAGLTTQDAVVCVTEGTLERLNRDELQAVVAHEFSHIFHGDMALNLRLVAWLEGILFIGALGLTMLRSTRETRSGSGSNRLGALLLILVIGLGLTLIGYIGVFFARMIKAQISQHREFLADASAVQYTRNPGGLLGVFTKMVRADSTLRRASRAEELSHMFFGPGLFQFASGLFATHPPLMARVAAIDARYAKEYQDYFTGEDTRISAEAVLSHFESFQSHPAMNNFAQSAKSSASLTLEDFTEPTQQSLVRASGLLQRLPAELLRAARSPQDAPLLCVALFLSDEPKVLVPQLTRLRTLWSDEERHAKLSSLKELLAESSPSSRLAILELCAPQLRLISFERRAPYCAELRDIAQWNGVIDAREAAFLSLLEALLLHPSGTPKQDSKAPQGVGANIQALLWLFASAAPSSKTLERYRIGVDSFFGGTQTSILGKTGPRVVNFVVLSSVLRSLRKTRPLVKARICEALLKMAQMDGVIQVEEWELLKAIMSALAVPIPRGIASQFYNLS